MSRHDEGTDGTIRRIEAGPAPVGIAMAIAFLLRAAMVMGSDFPLRDGSLSVTMARDIRDAAFVLPQFSSFNTGEIPQGATVVFRVRDGVATWEVLP